MAGTVSFSVPVDGGTEATEEPKIPTALTTLRDALNAVLASSNKLDGAQVEPATIPNAAVAAAAGISYSKLASMSTGAVLLGNAGTPTATALSGDATVGATGAVTLSTAALAKNANAYRTVASADGVLWDTGGGNPTTKTYLLGSNDALNQFGMEFSAGSFSADPRNTPPCIFYFAHADHDVSGLTTKVRLRAQTTANATAPGITFTYGLYPVTVAGGADTLVYTVGSVTNAVTAQVTPSASTVTQSNSGDVTIPSDGAYLLAVATSGTLANNSAVSCHAQLQVRNV